jgi:predicted RNase H-related nuclease YkuK (DUF458 family)
VVANLPYRITAPLLARLLEAGGWERLVVMVQREVGERVLAEPGTKAYGAFTLLVRYHARPEWMRAVPRGAFLPPPEVESAVLRLWPDPAPYPRQAFFTVVRAAFAQRRKTLANALGRSPAGGHRRPTAGRDPDAGRVRQAGRGVAWTFGGRNRMMGAELRTGPIPEERARGMQWQSPTRGALSFERMFAELVGYMEGEPGARYKLIIGTDSQAREDSVVFVTAVVVHRIGKGARYFYQRRAQHKITSLRQKIFYETSLSLGLAGRIAERLSENGHAQLDVEIHLDVGPNGDTRDLIREIVGMVTGSGFDAKIKPDSYGASKVADKYTK